MAAEIRKANILGELTAEADRTMLHSAFLESRNYRELTQGNSFSFVVGRRGTGKSALFAKVTEALARDKTLLLLSEKPDEAVVRACHVELQRIANDYTSVRMIMRLAWKVQLLSDCVDALIDHYKAKRLQNLTELQGYRTRHPDLFEKAGTARSLQVLRTVSRLRPGEPAGAYPELIAEHYDLSTFQADVYDALSHLGLTVHYLFDGLDEGWTPNQVATAVLGGLAKLAAELRESRGIHCLLFIRDNMFRALAELDDDFTRNIEGNVLRLHWDEEALLALICLRLRTAFGLTHENDIRVWNRFAKRELDGIGGFRRCLKLTLYRPRDVIALLNGAFQIAGYQNRDSLIDDDIEKTATQISQTRLSDLCKEYEQVLPGLKHFAEAFRGVPQRVTFQDAVRRLEGVVGTPVEGAAQRDFSLLSSGTEAFAALYSVGFIGVEDGVGSVRFCHDGSNTDVHHFGANKNSVVHPCYWRALDISESDEPVVVRVDDEEDITRTDDAKHEVTDMRMRLLGTVIARLGNIPLGTEGAHQFEGWLLSAAQYLFARGLENIALKPNPGQVQQRDIVGTLREDGGPFWRRVARYDVNQFIIEAKNFETLSADEFRQAWGYLTGPYGRLMMIVTRSESDSLGEHERALVKEGYDSDGRKMVLVVSAKILLHALRKMQRRQEKREDYVGDRLGRKLDLFEREYVQQRSPRVRKKHR